MSQTYYLGEYNGPLYYFDFTSSYPFCGTFVLPIGDPIRFLPDNPVTYEEFYEY